jgi:hypothetical protein
VFWCFGVLDARHTRVTRPVSIWTIECSKPLIHRIHMTVHLYRAGARLLKTYSNQKSSGFALTHGVDRPEPPAAARRGTHQRRQACTRMQAGREQNHTIDTQKKQERGATLLLYM